MNRIFHLSVLLFLFLPCGLLSQKVKIDIVETKGVAVASWKVVDDHHTIIASDELPGGDTLTFSLEADRRYFFHVNIREVYSADTSLYSLFLNGNLIMITPVEECYGEYSYPFYTGVKSPEVKITGGTDADISEFPWQVYYRSGGYMCGGSIIDGNWVVTAAHCAVDDNDEVIPVSEMYIKAGATNPYDIHEGVKIDISEVIIHENYNSTTYTNDIALLRLSVPVDIEDASPVKLMSAEDVTEGATDPGVMSWVTGWGLTHVDPDILPAILQKVELPVVSNEQASVVWGTIPPTNIMAGYLSGNKDACSGDSGGPLVVPVLHEYKLAGIVSWGSVECNTYGGYTRVSSYEEWIRTMTGIERLYMPSSPEGDSIICQGTVSTTYTLEIPEEVTAYEWKILPDEAGTVNGSGEEVSVSWNESYTGPAYIISRVTIDGKVSEWSRREAEVVKITTLTATSADAILCEGDPFHASVEAEGYDLTYTWYHDENQVAVGETDDYFNYSTRTEDSGIYSCKIEGVCGTLFSDDISLTVHPETGISDFPEDMEALSGDDVMLEVEAQGHNLVYQWSKDSELLYSAGMSGLLLTDVNASDIGLYKVDITGTCGSVTSDPVYLYVSNDLTPEGEAIVWPTVTNDQFNIAVNGDMYYHLRIYSTLGTLVMERYDLQYQSVIDISLLSKGMYIVNVYSNNLNRMFRIIKS